jgi:hypothetical protein
MALADRRSPVAALAGPDWLMVMVAFFSSAVPEASQERRMVMSP